MYSTTHTLPAAGKLVKLKIMLDSRKLRFHIHGDAESQNGMQEGQGRMIIIILWEVASPFLYLIISSSNCLSTKLPIRFNNVKYPTVPLCGLFCIAAQSQIMVHCGAVVE